jgi:hypothetical protein
MAVVAEVGLALAMLTEPMVQVLVLELAAMVVDQSVLLLMQQTDMAQAVVVQVKQAMALQVHLA